MSNVLSRAIPAAQSWALPMPTLLSVLRIMTGLLFLEHGTGKLLGFPAGLPFIDKSRPDCFTSPERWSSSAGS
jgi:uncharacterized membrane protein YphA (DoxX/SURF4 family)